MFDDFAARVEAFDSKHAEGQPTIEVGGWVLFASGARRESNPMGCWMQPPTDPVEKAKASVRYREALFNHHRGRFEFVRNELARACQAALMGPCQYSPPDGMLDELERRRLPYAEAKKALARAQLELQRVIPPDAREQALDEHMLKNRGKYEEVLRRLNEMAEL